VKRFYFLSCIVQSFVIFWNLCQVSQQKKKKIFPSRTAHFPTAERPELYISRFKFFISSSYEIIPFRKVLLKSNFAYVEIGIMLMWFILLVFSHHTALVISCHFLVSYILYPLGLADSNILKASAEWTACYESNNVKFWNVSSRGPSAR
jgi:hypothetical protein